MMSYIKRIAFASLALMAAPVNGQGEEGDSTGAFRWYVPCTPCAASDAASIGRAVEECVVNVKVNYFASETGYYEIDGCIGVNPTLYLTVGRTYLFDQSDDSNYYHLIGFAYEADGAHAAVDELEPGIPPGNSNCSATFSCPAPMYYMKGEYTGFYSNNPDLVDIPEPPSDDFGLDIVEPLFFHPFGEWQGYGPFVTALKFDVEYDQDFFYFCHVHAGMSARIKLRAADGTLLNEENTPLLPYEYTKIEPFDYQCGTTNLTDYSKPELMDTCASTTVFEEGIEPETPYVECVEAMNCHMMASMTTNAVGRSALFCHQMIPHHQNAINMAKALMKQHDFYCETGGPVEEGMDIPWECELIPILYHIINVQASQNIDMRDALSQLGEEEYANCDVDFTTVNDFAASRKLAEAEPVYKKESTQRKAEECVFNSGIECKLCEDEEGDCVVKVGIDMVAGEWGYYVFEGCEGVNPTLHMEVGRTYLFDQSDISNWYHLIGFSYFADGAHAGVDELEPGIAPGDSTCAENLSCPAPMYWAADEYTGVYSNTDHLVAVNGSEDFGLDFVEPLFFHPLADWETYGPFVTSLTFDDENYDEDIFYFCHVHSGMTGRIKLIGSDGSKLNEDDTPDIGYEYDCVSSFDEKCGTYGLDGFQPDMNDMCPNDGFICYDGAGTIGDMVQCVDAMDCHMLSGMSVVYGDEGKSSQMNDVILFLRSMIPHHQNAVNMAKNLLITGETSCSLEGPVEEGDTVSTACLLDPIVRGIINTQNSQIQAMQGLLEAFSVDEVQKPVRTMDESHAVDSKSMKSLLGVFIALVAGFELLAV